MFLFSKPCKFSSAISITDRAIDGACFVKTDVPAKIVKKGIMKAGSLYWCSEEQIQAVNKANPDFSYHRTIDFGYGKCTKDGWVPWPTNLTQ